MAPRDGADGPGATPPAGPWLVRMATAELEPGLVQELRDLLWAAFDNGDPEEAMTEEDWQHALGGTHVILRAGPRVLGHASVVPREIHVGGLALDTGYVEAVAVAPDVQGKGLGTMLMREVNEVIVAHGYQLGMLATGSQGFYEPLGWRTWVGPSLVRDPGGLRPTPEDDGYLMVLATPATPALDLSAPISCQARPGDDW